MFKGHLLQMEAINSIWRKKNDDDEKLTK